MHLAASRPDLLAALSAPPLDALGGRTPGQFALFLAGLLVLVLAAVGIQRLHGMGLGRQMLVAILRAGLQLSLVAVLLRGVLAAPWTVLLFIALMLSTASWTAIGRLRELPGSGRAVVVGVVAGAGTAILAVIALRLVEWRLENLIAVSGILIGNAMTAATLSGRTFLRQARGQRDQVEAWFSLGAQPHQAYAPIAREAAREAVIPTLDQTRATGMVTLPGAFVGALFGGLSPVEAAMFQLTVLAGILLVQSICATIVTRLAARSPQLIADPA